MKKFLRILVILSTLVITFAGCNNSSSSAYLPAISTEEEFKAIGTYIGDAGKIAINDDRTGTWTPSENFHTISTTDINFTWTISGGTISLNGSGITEYSSKLKLRGNKIFGAINGTNIGNMVLNPLNINNLKGKSIKLIYPSTEKLDENLRNYYNNWYITSLKFDNDGITGTANVRTIVNTAIKTSPAIGSFNISDDHITIRGLSSLGSYGFRYSKAKIHDGKMYVNNHDTGRIIYSIQ